MWEDQLETHFTVWHNFKTRVGTPGYSSLLPQSRHMLIKWTDYFKLALSVKVSVCLSVLALQKTGNLLKVYPCLSITAEIGHASCPEREKWLRKRMDGSDISHTWYLEPVVIQ